MSSTPTAEERAALDKERIERYHSLFIYRAGDLVWKIRPLSHFGHTRAANVFNAKLSGKIAGNINPSGYRVIWLDKRQQKIHRIVWEMHNGPIPGGIHIDHINGNPLDNRVENLRLATREQNMWNSKSRSGTRSGAKGVYWVEKTKKWGARVGRNGRTIYFGQYATVEEAAAAYDAGVAPFRGEFHRKSSTNISPRP